MKSEFCDHTRTWVSSASSLVSQLYVSAITMRNSFLDEGVKGIIEDILQVAEQIFDIGFSDFRGAHQHIEQLMSSFFSVRHRRFLQ
jgi:hypothetical protein